MVIIIIMRSLEASCLNGNYSIMTCYNSWATGTSLLAGAARDFEGKGKTVPYAMFLAQYLLWKRVLFST